ncbi:hypothetical protein MBLNU459_g1044t1 [Dothideomycetes sp. NU459]
MELSSTNNHDPRVHDHATPPSAVPYSSPGLRRAEAKLDEGYSGGSEETRSLSDSDTTMQLDVEDPDMIKASDLSLARILNLPAEERTAFIASIILGLPESERSDTAYAALRSLRTSSIASIVERLNPLLHLDPVIHLPPEITAHVFLHLSPADLLKSSAASKQWRERALDGNLWRIFFGREGWASNNDELRWTEARESRRRLAASRNAAQKAPRRKPEAELERSSSIKRQRESNERPPRPRQAAGRADEWREQHGTLEADDDLVMQEVGSLTTSRSTAGDAQAHRSPSMASIRSEDSYCDASDVHSGLAVQHPDSDMFPALHPTLFSSRAQSPRINWLYLYKQRRRLEENWNRGRYTTFQLPHPDHLDEAHDECVYTIQHSRKWLVSGSRDKTIAIWDLDTQRRVRTLAGAHTASVLCLQFDERPAEDIVVSGGSDSFVVIWKFSTGRVIRKMDDAHAESVLNLRFDHRYLITCSKDKTIKIWNRHEVFLDDPIVPAVARRQLELGGMNPLQEYTLLASLEGHGAAVNAIQIHEGQIVSASGDRTIKAWDINTGNCNRTYTGHTKGIACVQFDGRRIVSGSSDNTVRIFDATTTAEVACLQGHSNLVRTVQARFGDMQDSDEDLEAAARAVDEIFYDARRNGHAADQQRRSGFRNAGSIHPNDVCAIGAKVPPGGGGNAWSRIVSGSYDETVIIWKKDSDGKWLPSRRLRQDEVLHPRTRRTRQHAPQQAPIPIPTAGPGSAIQITPQQLHQAHQQAIANNGNDAPAVVNVLTGGQLPHMNVAQAQTFTASLVALAPPTSNPSTPNAGGHGMPAANAGPVAHPPPVAPHAAHPHPGQHAVPAHARNRDESNRVFKLQFDSRRIVSCSQNRIIVGWDFAAGDPELEEASRFFGETH